MMGRCSLEIRDFMLPFVCVTYLGWSKVISTLRIENNLN